MVATKSILPIKTNHEKFENLIASPFCIESQCIYVKPTVYRFPEKAVNKILLFVINVGYKDIKIVKGHTSAYLISVLHEPYYADDANSSAKVIHNISAAVSETEVQMSPAIQIGSKMIFPGDHTLIGKVELQDAKISKGT